MKPQEEDYPGKIVQIKFFVNQMGMVEQVYLIELNGRKVVWEAGDEKDFPDIPDEDLKTVFQRLALGNPEDFRRLYEILQASKQKRLWRWIQATKREIQRLFTFS